MAAALTNIITSTYTKCTDIVLIDSTPATHAMKEVWYCNDSAVSTKIWEKTSGESATWVGPTPSNSSGLVAYTPATNVSVVSFEMICDNGSTGNMGWGIYTAYSAYGSTYGVPIANSASGFGSSGVSVVLSGTYLTKSMYTHTKIYSAGSYPQLTAGTTYYFGVGAHYTGVAKYFLSGTAAGNNSTTSPYLYHVLDWSIAGNGYIDGVKSGTTAFTQVAGAMAYLKVTTA